MPGVIIRGYHSEEGPIDLTADRLGHCLIAHGPEHYMTHEGKHYTLAHYFSAVGLDEYARIRFKTHATYYYHAVFFGIGSAGFTLSAFRDPDFTHNASNIIVAYNKNDVLRLENPDPTQEACYSPSGSGSGDVFIPPYIIGAGGNIFQVGAGNARDANEVILNPDTVYLLEAQSLADNNYMTIGFDFYYRTEGP